MAKTLIVILGPTAVGKTSLAVKIALLYHTEIISADSRQFYKELEVGTAKPSLSDLKRVRHHLINSLSIHDAYTVADYETDAVKRVEKVFEHNDIAVLVGGSGLYIQAVCNGFDELPPADPELRRLLVNKSLIELQKQLEELDPAYYTEVDRNNSQRLIRAVEVCLLTGRPYSHFRKKQKKQRSFHCIKVGLDRERKELYKTINFRVDEMLRDGLLEEAKALYPFRHLNALQTVGYTELFNYMEGRFSYAEAVDEIKKNTRRYAKRQLTWFRKDPEIQWFQQGEEEAIQYIRAL